jgi:alpha-L-rhamnosidase
MTYSITVPANSTATVRLSGAIKTGVSVDDRPLEEAEGVSGVSQGTGEVTLQAGSGSYEFRYKYT